MRGEMTITYFTLQLPKDRFLHRLSEIYNAPVIEGHKVSIIVQLPENDDDMQSLKMGTITVDDIASESAIRNIVKYMNEAPIPLWGAEASVIIAEEGVEYQIECLFDDVEEAMLLHGSTFEEWEKNKGARIISCEKETIH